MKNYLWFLIILYSFSSCADKEITGKNPEVSIETKTDSLAARYLELGRFSGSILIALEDSIIYHKSYGLANYGSGRAFSDKTSFKIGEISEILTAKIVEDKIEKGFIDPNEKAVAYLPELKGNFTINDLLYHQSGLPTIQAVKAMYPNQEYSAIHFANLAGSTNQNEHTKSDLNYNLLGMIIEKTEERSFEEILTIYSKEWYLENTYVASKGTGTEAKGYLFNNYRGNGLELVESPEYDPSEAFAAKGIKANIQDVFRLSRLAPQKQLEVDGYLQEDGFSYSLSKDNNSGLTIIILSNRKHPVAKEMSNSIKAIVEGQPYEIPLQRKPVELPKGSMDDFAGNYSLNPNMELEVKISGDSLFLMMGPNKVHLEAQAPQQFFMKERDAEIRFLRDSLSNVTGAILMDGFLHGTEITKVK